MSSQVSYVKGGRTRQKARTQSALMEAARQLMSQGVTPTVEQAAAQAGVSRATAYRYFPNQRALLVSAYPIIERRSLLPEQQPPADAIDRVRQVARGILESIVANEVALRAQLRISLEESARAELPLRQGRRIMWFEDALAPLRTQLRPRTIRRLTLALAAVVSLEVLIWLVDVAGLSRKAAVEHIVWTAEQIMGSATTSLDAI